MVKLIDRIINAIAYRKGERLPPPGTGYPKEPIRGPWVSDKEWEQFLQDRHLPTSWIKR